MAHDRKRQTYEGLLFNKVKLAQTSHSPEIKNKYYSLLTKVTNENIIEMNRIILAHLCADGLLCDTDELYANIYYIIAWYFDD